MGKDFWATNEPRERPMKEGHCEEEGVKCSPEEKKKDSKKMMKKEHVEIRREYWEFLDEISVTGSYAGVDGENNLKNPKDAKTGHQDG